MTTRGSGGPSAAFSNLNIKTKITIGFSVVLVLLIALGAVSYVGLGRINEATDTYSRIAATAVRVAVIERDFVGMRRNALQFTLTGDDAAAKIFRERFAGLKKNADEAVVGIVSAERRAGLNEAMKLVEAYAANFERAHDMRVARDKTLFEKLNPLGLEARTSLSKVIESAMRDKDFEASTQAGIAMERLMLMRLEANRFAQTSDVKVVSSFKDRFAAFKEAMNALEGQLQNPERRQLAQTAIKDGDAYAVAFNGFVEATMALERLMGETMADLAEKGARALSDLRSAQSKALADIRAANDNTMDSISMTTLSIAIGATGLGLVIAWVIGTVIARPVIDMTEAMQRLAGGDIGVAIPAEGRADEIGRMAATVVVFKNSMIEADRLRAEQEELKRRAEAERRSEMMKLADEFENSVKGVVNIVSSASTELQSTAEAMSATAEETERQSTVVAAAAEQASTNVQTVASAAEELSASISEISRQVAESASIAGKAVDDVTRTNAQVQVLAEAADKIGVVVSLINDIAGQTNLLALNATIEAARAGEAGKGFAVVASEVKNLANQTAKATDEIGAQIKAIQNASGDSVTAIRAIGATIGRIDEIATAIAAAIEEQGAATQEIARNVQQASAGTSEVSSNIVGVTRAASDTGAAASQVLSSAGELAKQSSALSGHVDTFIAKVRAG